MAYAGYLFKFMGTNTKFPTKYIALNSYKCTPDQRMESSATRTVNGVLKRKTVSHTATKIDFDTVPLTNADLAVIQGLLDSNYISAIERKVRLSYYDMATDAYKTGYFYVPDIDYTIHRVDNVKNIIYYDPIRIAFIEY